MLRQRLLVAALAALMAGLPLAATADEVMNLVPKDEQPVDTGPSMLAPTNPDTTDTGGDTRSIALTGGKSRSIGSDTPDMDTQPMLQTRHFGAQIELVCSPSDRPGALVVINHSADPLPAGTRIKWQFPQMRQRGFFKILGDLPAGGTLVADNVLDKSKQTAGECSARVI